mgnify:CR=1 FL=1
MTSVDLITASAGWPRVSLSSSTASRVITAVSRTYAQEIQGSELGFGLDWLTRARSGRLIGIVNGVDYGEWDPATDPHLPFRYSADDLSGKREMKRTLLQETGIGGDESTPIVGIVSRLTFQKGFDLAFDALPAVLARREGGDVLPDGVPEGMARLVARFESHDWSRPIVKNHIQGTLLGADFPGLEGLVLVPSAAPVPPSASAPCSPPRA